MNILASTPLYPPRSRVGAWLTTHEFLSHLAGRGHAVTVCPYMQSLTYTLDGVDVQPGFHFPKLVADADVILSHCGDIGKAHELARDADRPSVRLYHGGPVQGLDGSAVVVFNSESAKAASSWDGPSVVCPPATVPEKVRVTPGDSVTLVNLSREKGGGTFIKLAQVMPGTKFLGVIGHTGAQRKPRTRNVEVVSNTPDIRDVFSRTRILLMPSKAETWGRVGVEAMCSGIPVIAHPTPGLEESLGDAGIFVPRGDIKAWVAEIERLEDPDEWRAQSEKALARVAELDPEGSLDRFADTVEALV